MAKTLKKRLPTTNKMVNDALIELHSIKGVTFKQLLSFIAGKYVIEVSNMRETLIKKRLGELREADELVNKTGRGLNGHFKLVDKKSFQMRSQNVYPKPRSKKRGSSKPSISLKVESQSKTTSVKEIQPLDDPLKPLFTPPRKKSSMFNTPSTATASEIFQLEVHPNVEKANSYMQFTPIRSLPPKKKRLADSFEELF